MNWQKMDFDKQKKTIHKAQRILADLDSANL